MQDVLLFVTVAFAALGSWWVTQDRYGGFKRFCFCLISSLLWFLFIEALRGKMPSPAWVATGSFITLGIMWIPLILEWMGNTVSVAGGRHAEGNMADGPPDFREARGAFDEGDDKRGLALIYQQLEINPHSYEGRMLLANFYLAHKVPKKALKELEWLKDQSELTEAQSIAVTSALRQADKLVEIGY